MGAWKSLAREHAVGGTARWAAKGYLAFANQDPNIEFADACKALIKLRFLAMPSPQEELALLAVADSVVGLRGLVVAILTVEAGFWENEQEDIRMFMEVIDEELWEFELPDKVIFGEAGPRAKKYSDDPRRDAYFLTASSSGNFSNVFISGVLHILIGIGVWVLGFWLTTQSGFWPFLGWPVVIIALPFITGSVSMLWRLTRLQIKGKRLMQVDPEGFERIRRVQMRLQRDEVLQCETDTPMENI